MAGAGGDLSGRSSPSPRCVRCFQRFSTDPAARYPQRENGLVGDIADAADDWIAEHISAVDVSVTADIPLASRCLKKGARVASPTGKQWTTANIGLIGAAWRIVGIGRGAWNLGVCSRYADAMPDLSQFFADLDLPSRKPCKPSHTEAYLRYLASEEWQRQREAALERADRMCQRCYEDNPYLLQVHHLTYAHARLGHERPEDLQVLCTFCHDQEHRRQRTAGEAAYEDELWIRRVEDWRFRRYGEAGIWNWAEVEDEFEDWLDGREYW